MAPGTRPPPLRVPESRLPQPPASLGQGTSASCCGQGCGDQLALGLAKAATTSLDPMLDLPIHTLVLGVGLKENMPPQTP